ncbi:hypothetical protein [Sphingobacterium spiritivorum]|uniref:hypothetical protein n=1 Tax=Sphingobacterium spiritivorum TaxID=258 RepID=UPI003DA270FD
MKTTLFSAIIALLVLTSCGGKYDYGYNEKMSSLFLSCMEKVDESHEKLMNGEYNISKANNEISYDMALKNANGLIKYTNQIKAEAQELTHSEIANKFHDASIAYMTEIGEGYAPLLVKYIEEQDSVSREAIRKELILKKESIDKAADKSQEVQIEFLNKAGIKINTEG